MPETKLETQQQQDTRLAADFPGALDNLQGMLDSAIASARRAHDSARARWKLTLGVDETTAKLHWLAAQNIAAVIRDLQAARERL